MTGDQLRNIRVAEWHAFESIGKAAVGDHENADYHLSAARESLRNSKLCFVSYVHTADDIAAMCTTIKDEQGIVS